MMRARSPAGPALLVVMAAMWLPCWPELPGLGSRTAFADRAEARYFTGEGERLEAEGKPAAALIMYERAMVADADYRPAYERAVPLWLAGAAHDRIITHFERLTRRYPDYVFGWYTLGFAYRATGRISHAIAAYQLCVDLRPGDASAYFGLGMAYKKAGRPGDAVIALGRYIELERDPAKAEYADEARQTMRELGATPPEPAPEPEVTGTAGADSTAATATGKPAARVRVTAWTEPRLVARARALVADGRIASAEAAISRFRPRGPREMVAALLVRAEIAQAQGHVADARRLTWAALAIMPASPRVHRLLRAAHGAGR